MKKLKKFTKEDFDSQYLLAKAYEQKSVENMQYGALLNMHDAGLISRCCMLPINIEFNFANCASAYFQLMASIYSKKAEKAFSKAQQIADINRESVSSEQ
jgi:hypothetical protein